MRLIYVVLLTVACAASVFSQTAAPVIVEKSQPEYSDAARQARVTGSVLLSVVISPEGQATNFRVVRSLGFGLDEKAIEAVGRWRFKPGTREGQPVSVQAQIEVGFRFSDKGWLAQKISFGAADDVQNPSFISAKFPDVSSPAEAKVILDCNIDEKGHPVNIKIKNPSGEKYENELVTALKQWSFNPAMRNGQPVTIAATFEFVQHSN